jgi:hypothetical protein
VGALPAQRGERFFTEYYGIRGWGGPGGGLRGRGSEEYAELRGIRNTEGFKETRSSGEYNRGSAGLSARGAEFGTPNR